MLQNLLVALFVPLSALTILLGYLALTRRAVVRTVVEQSERPALDDATEVTRNVRRIEEVIERLSGGMQNHARDVQQYDDTLVEHKHALLAAHSMRSMRDLERLLQEELDSMHRANETYRTQLEAANKTIAQQRAQLDALQMESTHDFLTEVPNRRAFDRRLHEEIDRFRRGGPPFSLVLLDIDNFKQVNDRYGHNAGDEVLQAVANLIDNDRRATDFTSRYGGEEFAMLLPCTGEMQACVLVDRIRATIAATPIRAGVNTIVITISAGIAEMLPADQGSTAITQRADERLYRAKQQGRNQVVVS